MHSIPPADTCLSYVVFTLDVTPHLGSSRYQLGALTAPRASPPLSAGRLALPLCLFAYVCHVS